MGFADVVHPSVAGEVGHHLDAHLLQVFGDDPDLTGQVEVAEQVHRVRSDVGGVGGADQRHQRFTSRVVALLLRSLEALGLHRHHRDAVALGDLSADRRDVIADDADDAGGVDEGRSGLMPFDQLDQAGFELLLAAEHDVAFAQVGGKAQSVQFRAAGQRPADVPGVDRTPDRTVHQVHRVRDR